MNTNWSIPVVGECAAVITSQSIPVVEECAIVITN